MARGEDTRNHPNRSVGPNSRLRQSLMTQYGVSDDEAWRVIDMHRSNQVRGDHTFYRDEDMDDLNSSDFEVRQDALQRGEDPASMVKYAVKNIRKPYPVTPAY